ncbi:MAG: hypothetical protein ACP5FL_08020, partial [Thermoplasmatota archaeon]
MDCSMASTALLQHRGSVAVPQLRLSVGSYRIDRFLNGFFSSQLYHVVGSSMVVQAICAMVMVQTVQQFDGTIVFLDGGNAIDPYVIARCARARRADADHVLSNIQVARAFTAYQLDTLIKQIPHYVTEYNPQLVIVNGITDLLHDKDVTQAEADRLLSQWLPRSKQQADMHNHVALVTTRRDTSFSHHLMWYADNSYSFDRQGDTIHVGIAGQQRYLQYQPVPLY